MSGKIIIGLVVLIVAAVGIMIIWGFRLMNAQYGDKRKVLQSKTAIPKKALVVYQPSVTKASALVAHSIAQGLNDSGFEVIINHPGPHMGTDVSPYDVIVFGGPNYGSSLPRALMDYIGTVRGISSQRVVLFSTAGGGKDASPELRMELKKMEIALQGRAHAVKPFSSTRFNFSENEINRAQGYQLGKDAGRM